MELGGRVELSPGPGIVPGSRLQAGDRKIAVRTSLDREIGLTRDLAGSWTTIPRVDEVIVAVPAAEDPLSAEVMSFLPEVLIEAFDAALAAQEECGAKLSPKAPVFMALDEVERGRLRGVSSGLKAKARWIKPIRMASVPLPKDAQRESVRDFKHRVRREFAELVGLDVKEVDVQLMIL